MFWFCEDGGDREEEGQGLVLLVFQMLRQDFSLHLEFRPRFPEASGLDRRHGDKQPTQLWSQTMISTAIISIKLETCSVYSPCVVKDCNPNHFQGPYRQSRLLPAPKMLIGWPWCLLYMHFSSLHYRTSFSSSSHLELAGGQSHPYRFGKWSQGVHWVLSFSLTSYLP